MAAEFINKLFRAMAVLLALSLAFISTAQATCRPIDKLGPTPTRLVVITPATGQGRAEWQTFIEAMKREPGSADMALLVFEHDIHMLTLGTAHQKATELSACIAQKLVADPTLGPVTLIGHSIGGMLTRRAYLDAASATSPDARWSSRVDKILLFTSVNRGIPATTRVSWWAPVGGWLLHNVPRFGLPVHFVLEDLQLGSDFIADIRIGWIRHFGRLAAEGGVPQVVQFWGTQDSVVTQADNTDLAAFNGDVVVQVPDAQHANLQRLEERFTADPAARWALFRQHLFAPPGPVQARTNYPDRRVLFIVRGIRDSAYSEWVSSLRTQAEKVYGPGNVITPEYGFFTAAQFAMKPIRRRNIPSFRDLYAEQLAKNPRTQFDVIAHSNGTYIVAESLASTPSMQLRHVALAAPVLPQEFPWANLHRRGQFQALRYDTARQDWPVGILCPGLRALGYDDVGPAGLVLFGVPTHWGDGTESMRRVGWYPGGHGAALMPGNREHLLRFVDTGTDFSAGEKLQDEAGSLAVWTRLTPYLLWLVIVGVVLGVWRWRRKATHPARWSVIGASTFSAFVVVYLLLDAF